MSDQSTEAQHRQDEAFARGEAERLEEPVKNPCKRRKHWYDQPASIEQEQAEESRRDAEMERF